MVSIPESPILTLNEEPFEDGQSSVLRRFLRQLHDQYRKITETINRNNKLYGCIEGHSVASENDCDDQDTWYQIVAFDTNNNSYGVTPDHTNNHLTILKKGVYLTILSWAGYSAQPNDYEIQVQKNSGATALAALTIHRTTAVANRIVSSAVTCVPTFNANDTIEAWVRCTDADAKTITTDHINLTVLKIGEP